MKKEKPKSRARHLFIFLSIGVSGLSLYNGFGFYQFKWGTVHAGIISGVQEVVLLSCLYFLVGRKIQKYFVVLIIFLVALAGWRYVVNVRAFEYANQNKIDERISPYKKEYMRLENIYAIYIKNILNDIEVNIKINKNGIAFAKSKRIRDGFEQRLRDRLNEKKELLKERNQLIENRPTELPKIRLSIRRMAILTGEKVNFAGYYSESNKIASNQSWGISEKTENTIFFHFYSALIECALLLFVFMAYICRIKKVDNGISESDENITVDQKKWLRYNLEHSSIDKDIWRKPGSISPKKQGEYRAFRDRCKADARYKARMVELLEEKK